MHPLWVTALLVLALNVIVSVFSHGAYLIDFAGFRLPAQTPYKPLLLLNGALLLYFLSARRPAPVPAIAERGQQMPMSRILSFRFALLLAFVVLAAYLPALAINFSHQDWTHRHIGATLNSWPAVWRLFTVPQPDGMYRPLAFLSFWLDYHLFGAALWGYHLQSIGVHLINSALVAMLGARLGFSVTMSRMAAVLFGVSAVHFEAVLWPAARFDLLAALFSVLSLLFFLAHWEATDKRSRLYSVLSLLSYVVAVLNKETAYSLVLITPALVAIYPIWSSQAVRRAKAIPFLIALLVCTVMLIGIRLAIFGNLGGYAYATGRPSDTTASLKSVYLLIVNVLPLSVFGINSTIQSVAATLITAAYSCLVVAWAFLYRGSRNSIRGVSSGQGVLWLLVLLSAVPAVTVIGWIQPSLQHTRYLYWPSLWVALLLALALERTSLRAMLISAFVVVQACGLSYNIWVYRDLLNRADRSVNRVKRDVELLDVTEAEIQLVGVPDEPNGVFFLRSELEERLRRQLPAVTIHACSARELCTSRPGAAVLKFQWDNQLRMLTPMRAAP